MKANEIMMQERWTNIALVTLVAATMSISSYSAQAQDASRAARRGERLVSAHCAMCHAIGRSDASAHHTAPPLRSVLQRYPMETLQESLVEGLTSGHPDMPTFRFTESDAAA